MLADQYTSERADMNAKRGFLVMIVPSATVFISSFCIMVLELVASRLIARHLGSSLYTWTAVIGVVLSGITIGNYIGGRVADRFQPRKALAVVFLLCSVACLTTIILNNLVGGWLFLWRLSWPMRVFSHVTTVFILPSVLLGTISPIVAKMALDRGLPRGRTVGDIYAWGAAGSIAGTFAAGYYLIAMMGTVLIVWVIGIVLSIMAIMYWVNFWPSYLWGCIFLGVMTMGIAPYDWAKESGRSLALRAQVSPSVIYEDESQYCHIAVVRLSEKPEIREFDQDKLEHSIINMEDISDLRYFYTKIYAAFTGGLSGGKDRLSVLVIGGGGYVYPRYVEAHWPGSRIDVAEIDPAVTEAAIQGFGLSRETTIRTINMDARNYVDDLFDKQSRGLGVQKYDFVYGDAVNDYAVPFQLVTKEFNDKIARLLTDDGVYMVNLIDIYDSGLFLGGVLDTLEETYPHVYVMAMKLSRQVRNTFVLAAAKKPLDVNRLISEYKAEKLELWILNDSEMRQLKQKSNGMVLTDDYAPVENLLAPVVRAGGRGILAVEYIKRAGNCEKQKEYKKSIAYYKAAAKVYPSVSVYSYSEMARLCALTGDMAEAAESLKKALEYNDSLDVKKNVATVHYNLAMTLLGLGESVQAREHLEKAVEGFKQELSENPNLHESWGCLGDVYATMGDFESASEAFAKAFSLDPANREYFESLLKALEYQGKYDVAIELLKNQIAAMKRYNAPTEAISQQQRHLKLLELNRSKPPSN
jgi:tetratricopeptide (TPR) repeat protein/MFS family permease